jgi:hypothetical protein
MLPIQRLERYSQTHHGEVLLVDALVDGEADELMIFRGFSSSLTRPTDPDPDVPLLGAGDRIERVRRFRAPYRPAAPQPLAPACDWAEMERYLDGLGL